MTRSQALHEASPASIGKTRERTQLLLQGGPAVLLKRPSQEQSTQREAAGSSFLLQPSVPHSHPLLALPDNEPGSTQTQLARLQL